MHDQVSSGLSSPRSEEEKEELPTTPLRVPSRCVNSFSKLQAGKAASLRRYSDLLQGHDQDELSIEEVQANAPMEDIRNLKLQEESPPLDLTMSGSSMGSSNQQALSLQFLSGMFKKSWQSLKQRTTINKKKQVSLFQDVTTARALSPGRYPS
jgi:hypothetical protein